MPKRITILGEDGLPAIPGVQIKIEDTDAQTFSIYDKGDLRRSFTGDNLTLTRKEDGVAVFSSLPFGVIQNGNSANAFFASRAALGSFTLINFFRKATAAAGGGGGTGDGILEVGSANDDIVITTSGRNRTFTLKPIPTAVAAALVDKASNSSVTDGDAAVVTQLTDGAPTEGNTLAKIYTKLLGLAAFINGTDINLDTILELGNAIKSDESLLALLTTGKVNVTDIVNNTTTVVSGKILDGQVGKTLMDLITQNLNSIAALVTAMGSKANLIAGKINPDEENGTVAYVGRLPGAGTNASPLTVNDAMLAAYQYLGSKLIGLTVGTSFLHATGSGGDMSSGFLYGTLIEIPLNETAVNIVYMLAKLGAYTPANENSMALFSYDPSNGLMTRVAKTADTPTMYSASASLALATYLPLLASYAITTRYLFLVSLFNASGTVTTAPQLANISWGTAGDKAAVKTVMGGKIAWRSATGGFNAMPASIDTSGSNTVNINFLPIGGVAKA